MRGATDHQVEDGAEVPARHSYPSLAEKAHHTMALNTYNLSRIRGVIDESSLERAGGHQIDWSTVTAGADGEKRVVGLAVMGRRVSGQLVPRSFALTLTSVVVATNVATATLVDHGLAVGDQIYIAGANLAYANGLKTVVSVPDADTFTFAATGANATATGTITASFQAVGLIETNAAQNAGSHALSGYSLLVGGVFYENLCPDAAGDPKVIPAQYKSELVASGCSIKFGPAYADSRAS